MARLLAAMFVCATVACRAAEPRDGGTLARPSSPVPMPPGLATVAAAPSAPPQTARRAIALVTDPAAIAEVAAAGGAFASLFGAPAAADTAALAAASPRYAALASALAADLAATARAHPDAGVGVRGNTHRLFDARWLRSAHTRFELVGVASRIDRAQLPHDCGDVRLLYRLAYGVDARGERISSRLPMTISVSLAARPNDRTNDCQADAAAWRAPESIVDDAAALGRWLVSDGPLAGALEPSRITLVLTNAQSLRTPAASQPRLGGHAEYQLRAFISDASGALVEAPLENTPDVARLRRDPTLRTELRAWLSDPATLDQIDRGVHRVPPHLLATRASSYSPFGLARPANRSFAALFRERELAALPLAGRATIATPEALLRRLDEATCQGCHQVRSVAGFHLVGVDPPDAPAGAAIAVAYSPRLAAERVRRAALIEAIVDGASPDFTRPLASAEPRASSPPGIGDACEVGTLRPSARGPERDTVANLRRVACGAGLSCTAQRGGFPGGMCQASCTALGDGAVCGVIAVHPFNDCLGSGAPFSKCMQHVRSIGLARCSTDLPCRDDYVCARTPTGDGACLPPYFLFPMRVDGHPL